MKRVTLAAALPWVTFAAGLLIIVVVVVALASAARHSDNLRLTRAAEEMTARIEQQIEAHLSLLRATHTFLETAREPVSPQTFREYVGQLRLRGRYLGIQGIGYIHRVPAAEASAAELALAPFYGGDFHIWPREGRDVLYPIVYIEPSDERNKAALGFDAASEPVRRDAMERAEASGDQAVSGLLTLKQEISAAPAQPGFVAFQAVRRLVKSAPEPEGFVYAAFRATDFFNVAIGPVGSATLSVEVFDGAPKDDKLLFRSAGSIRGEAPPISERGLAPGGHVWTLQFRPTPEFVADSSMTYIPYVGVLGALLAGALGFLSWQQFNAHRASVREASLLRVVAEDKELLLQEMKHRIKNVIARVQAISRQTSRSAASLDDFQASFDARLTAMSKTYDLLTSTQWAGASLRDVLRSELLSLMGRTEYDFNTSGPDIALGAREVLALGLAFHELATNALKYGALAQEGGSLSVVWDIKDSPAGKQLRIVWREAFANPVDVPEHRGFGSRLIDTSITRELDGQVDRDFRPEGLTVTITMGLRPPPALERSA